MNFEFKRVVNRVIAATIGLSLLFFVLASAIEPEALIVLLNGIFVGSMAAIFVAYWAILRNALLEITPYNRVRQMTLGFFLAWLAYGLIVAVSVNNNYQNADVSYSYATAASRYIAIVAAWLQVTAPDFGLGIFHGRDRKVLYTGVLVGAVVAAAVVWVQDDLSTWLG